MDEDEYYLDRYDCEPHSSMPSTPTEKSFLLNPALTPEEDVELDGVDYEDDYDHLYVDTDGAEEYLREIWTHLGVGYNGYLNLSELYRVCEHIGMSASEDMIEQLFDKLDNDQDGRVSFGEFVDGLFKYVHKTHMATKSSVCPPSTSSPHSATQVSCSAPATEPEHISPCYGVSQINSQSGGVYCADKSIEVATCATTDMFDESGRGVPDPFHYISSFTNFLSISTDKDGYTEPCRLIQLWETLGFHQGQQILKNLGFNTKQYINVCELWSQMEDRLCQATEGELYQISLATILNEFAQIKISYEHLSGKCDSLQANLAEANARAELLAQEVDEQHCQMEKSTRNKIGLVEKKYQDQIRLIENEFSREKELMLMQTCHLRQDIEKQMISVQEQIGKMRKNIIGLEEDNKRLEREYRMIKLENSDLQQSCIEMQRQVEECSHLQAKIVELESIECLLDSQKYQELVKEVDLLKFQNKTLKDQNDELMIEKDSLRQKFGITDCKQSILQMAMCNSVAFERIQKCNKRKKKRRKKTKQQRKEQFGEGDDGNSLVCSECTAEPKQKRNDFEVCCTADEIDDSMSTISTTTTCTTMDDITNVEQNYSEGRALKKRNVEPENYLFKNIDPNDSCDDESEHTLLLSNDSFLNWTNLRLSEEIGLVDVASQCMEHTGVDCDQPRYACDASTDSHCVELSLQFVISKLIKDCFDKQCRRIDDLSILKWMSDTSHQSYERQNVETDIGDAFSKIKDGLMLAVQAVKCNRQVGNLGEELSLGNLPNLWYKKSNEHLSKMFWDHYKRQHRRCLESDHRKGPTQENQPISECFDQNNNPSNGTHN